MRGENNNTGFFHETGVLFGEKHTLRKAAGFFVVAAVGFVLSSVTLGGGISPFGLAFIPCSGVSGLVGVLLGYWTRGEDIFRYAVAAAVNFFSYRYIREIPGVSRKLTAFMTTLWSILISGLFGLFIIRTSFEENCYFALSGVVAGIFSYVFLTYKDVLSRRGKKERASTKTEYLCCLASVAVFLSALSASGAVWNAAASVLAFFTVFCVSTSSGFFNALAYTSVIGFSMFASDSGNASVFAALMLGTLLASVVKPMGKYASMGAYAVAGLISCVYFRNTELPFMQLFNILAAGVIYLMLPKQAYNAITDILIPQNADSKKLGKIRKRPYVKKLFPIKGLLKKKNVCDTCSKCRGKYDCWVRDYNYTSDVFGNYKRALVEGSPRFPQHFRDKCPFSDRIAAELRSGSSGKKGFRVEYTKCSEPKAGERVCGDSCCVFPSGEDKQVFCITDGMGSGVAAARESIKSSKLLEQLILKGVEKEDALKLVNETLIKSEYETVLAIDLAVLDLKTGMCEFLKAGAAPTYVIRGGMMYELGSGSIPIGILDELSLEHKRSTLVGNDILLMVSDGLVSEGSEWLGILVQGMSELELQSPLLLTSCIMSSAKSLKKNISDDITVIAARLVPA